MRLQHARVLVREDERIGPLNAYRYLAGAGRLTRLGPAFGTKFIYFHNPCGLILDRLIATWYQAATGIDLHPTRWDSAMYAGYLATMCAWADQLRLPSDLLEEIGFTAVSKQRGNQWA